MSRRARYSRKPGPTAPQQKRELNGRMAKDRAAEIASATQNLPPLWDTDAGGQLCGSPEYLGPTGACAPRSMGAPKGRRQTEARARATVRSRPTALVPQSSGSFVPIGLYGAAPSLAILPGLRGRKLPSVALRSSTLTSALRGTCFSAQTDAQFRPALKGT